MEPNILTVEKKKAQSYAVKGCGEVKLQIKDVDTVTRTVTGFYNTFNFFDSDYDVILPGSVKKSISERGPKSDATAKIKHALHHDLTLLPGKIKVLEEKAIDGLSGTYFETRMSDTTLGNDTLKNYLEEVYDNHSIGFQYVQVEFIERDAKGWKKIVDNLINPGDAEKAGFLFAVKEIALYEGSTVAFGANKLTPFLGVKSGNKNALRLALIDRINKLNKTVKSGTQSDETLQSFEIQILQLKQMIDELTEVTTLKKTTPETGAGQKKEDESKNAIDFKYLANNINF